MFWDVQIYSVCNTFLSWQLPLTVSTVQLANFPWHWIVLRMIWKEWILRHWKPLDRVKLLKLAKWLLGATFSLSILLDIKFISTILALIYILCEICSFSFSKFIFLYLKGIRYLCFLSYRSYESYGSYMSYVKARIYISTILK